MSNTDTMTVLLRQAILQAIKDGDTYKGLERDTGLSRMSIMRFALGRTSIRLDLADKLAAHFGIHSQVKPKRKSR